MAIHFETFVDSTRPVKHGIKECTTFAQAYELYLWREDWELKQIIDHTHRLGAS